MPAHHEDASPGEHCAGSAGASPAPPRRGGRETPDEQHLWRSRGYLPHFDAPDLVQMITFRLADSLPAEVVQAILGDPALRRDAARRERLQDCLDAGHGACWLRDRRIAHVMEDTLLRFDGIRYHLLAWSVMPNHVHVLIEAMPEFPLDRVLHSWKSFTAHEANRRLGRVGRFWQVEYWDRYIRDAEHLENAARYIARNRSVFSSAHRGRR